VGRYDTEGSSRDVKVDNGTAFLADGLGGLLVLDVSDPASPQYAGRYRTSGIAREIFLYGDDIYVADEYSLGIYRYTGVGVQPGSTEIQPSGYRLSVFPNPFNERLTIRTELPINGYGEICVYNSGGRKVETVFSGWLQPNMPDPIWRAGVLASGVYILHLKLGNGITLTKTVVFQK
jgi:hypothetical protein